MPAITRETISVTSNLTTLERLRNHRRKRRSLLHFRFRLWKRNDRYENLADEGYQKPTPLLKKPAPMDKPVRTRGQDQSTRSLRSGHSESIELDESKRSNSQGSLSDDEPLLITELQLPERMQVDEPIEEAVDAFSLCSSAQPQFAVDASVPRPVTPDYISTLPTASSAEEEASLPAEEFVCTSTEENVLIISSAEPLSMETPVLDDAPPRPPVEPESQNIPSPPLINRKKCLRFADDVGQPLIDVHYAETMYTLKDLVWTRAIVLLLNTKKRKFEFIHVSYNIEERNTIADIVRQIPGMATDEHLRHQEYTALCRTTEFGRELINTIAIQGYDLHRDEILVAVVKGVSGNTQLTTAKPLLENKSILRAVSVHYCLRLCLFCSCRFAHVERAALCVFQVKKAKISGQAVKKVDSSPATETAVLRKNKVAPMLQEEDLDDSIPNMDMPDVSVPGDSREKYLTQNSNRDKVMVTRALNAGVVVAVVAFSLGGRRRCKSN